MKIAHLVIGGDLAGGQLVALRLAHATRERGGEAMFVAPSSGPFTARAASEGFRVATIDVGRLHRLAGVGALRSLLKRERASLLHTHTLAAANTLGRAAARLSRLPVVSHLHIENHFRPATRPLLRTADNVSARWCSTLIAVSEHTRNAYERQGYPRRIHVVYNGVQTPEATAADVRASLGVSADAPLIGEVARLCDVKGQRELIGALRELPGVHAVLVGADLEQGGEYQRALEREAERLGVRDRVLFAGRRDDVAAVLETIDVFVLPSWTEGLPLVVLEAMAHARPVVATPVGGTPEVVVDGETGVLVPPRDPAALAAALRRLLADAEERRRMGAAGLRRVREQFSEDAMTTRVHELYEEALR